MKLCKALERVIYYKLLFLVLFSCFAILLTVFYGTESYSVLHVFSHDESDQVQRLQRLLEKDTLNTGGFIGGFYSYGQVYPTVAFWLAKLLGAFGFEQTSYQLLTLVLKVLSTVFYYISGYVLFKTMLALNIKKILTYVFTFVFLIFPTYWTWSYTVHPDTLQMITIILPAYILLKVRNLKFSIVLASFVIGVSFGTKYSGIFLSIIIMSYVLISAINLKMVFREFFILSSWSFIAFIVGWLLFNPYVIVNFSKFFTELYLQGDYLKYGVGVPLNQNGLEWFRIYHYEFGSTLSLLLVAGITSTILKYSYQFLMCRSRGACKSFFSNRENIFIVSIIIYLAISLAYLIIIVKYREVRYSYHLLPYIILLSAYGFNLLISRYKIKKCYILVVSLFVIFHSYKLYDSNLRQLSVLYESKIENPLIKSGEWLKNNFSRDTSVLAGTYSYVESDYFKRYSMTYELNAKTIDNFFPDVVVMNRDIPGRYVWKKPGTLLSDLDFNYGTWEDKELLNDYELLYKKMTKKGSEWKVAYEDDAVVIFSKQ
ncbi:hypothetical protein HOL24_09715 [bacterium]|jgi:hypothetical protein|nr:hypothetical protein [bacterium]